MERISDIEELIMNNKLVEATLELKDIFQEYNDEELLNESIVLLSRINNATKKSEQGVVDYFDPEFSKIRVSLINIKSLAKVVLDLNQTPKSLNEQEEKNDVYTIVFEENFSGNENNWPIYNNTEQLAFIEHRRYLIKNFSSNLSRVYSIYKDVNENRNFKIRSRFHYLGGNETGGFGISWGESENGNCFRFMISSNGFFNIDYSFNNNLIDLKSWTRSIAINKGLKPNLLEVTKNREEMHFMINDKLVHKEIYVSFFGPKLGFFLGADLEVAIYFFQIHN